jgi:hypothetical protein
MRDEQLNIDYRNAGGLLLYLQRTLILVPAKKSGGPTARERRDPTSKEEHFVSK